ncbi:MAG: hypothetical protein KAW56_00090 [Candidatus Marinimicrobia bacterium]|nr:hypothetical protein [Candidatus Neomarinimicrobiota bacterium]
MFKYLLYFLFASELVGIILMENGAYSVSCGTGYRNGASLAFCGYIVLVLVAFFFTIKTNLFSFSFKRRNKDYNNFKSLSIVVLSVNLLFLFIMLFGAGAINVLLLKIGRGELRSTMGLLGTLGLGSLGQMITKGFAPVLLSCLSFVYRKTRKSLTNKLLLLINFITVFLIGGVLGYKSAAVFVLLPSLVILYWKIPLRKVISFFLISIIIFVLFAAVYDKKELNLSGIQNTGFTMPSNNAISFLLYRMTVLQGDVPWKVWDMHVNNKGLFPYTPTLLAVIGDKMLNVFTGISRRESFSKFASFHYATMLTHDVGYPLYALQSGYTNVSGSIFSEGLIAGGLVGVIILSIFAGIFAGINYKLIKHSIKNNNIVVASIASTYFCFGVFSWLNSGGIVTLFHIATILQFVIAFVLIKLVISITKGL